jgi:hypothetical protein
MSQQQQRWRFGPVKPHIEDATLRSLYGIGIGAAFMGLGLGINELNRSQCGVGTGGCFGGNPVQAGVGFAFLGSLLGATTPQLRSKCTRSGRAMLGIVGAAVGVTAAGAIMDVRLFNARTGDPATWRTMGTGLVGLGVGAGVATAIC